MTVRVIVLGDGLMGAAVAQQLAADGTAHLVLDHAAISAAGGISTAVAAVSRAGDVVVNAAALTNVDACEEREAEAMDVNGEEPGRLARLCRERDALLVHLSSDTVLDVTNVYARSKALGEERVRQEAGDDALIVRISTVFGPHPRRSDFVRFVVQTLREKGEVRAATDMLCSPTYTRDAARAILDGAAGGARGLQQFVNEERVSRYELALRAQATWSAPGVVRGVPLDELPFKARRPKDTSMRATMGAWHEPMSLQRCLDDYRTRWS